MPPGFKWTEVDMNDDAEASEVYELLTRNYVEDDDSTFRFDYSVEFLKWALTPPGFFKHWHVGTTKTLKVPSQTATPGFRSMERTDVPQVARLLKENLWKFHLAVEYDEKEIAHWMVPRLGVVSAYVVENVESHEITDVCSYYHLPSTIIGDDKHKKIYAAYSFYNVATSVSLTQLMQDALVMAKKEQLDVFNALDVMENAEMLQPLKFGPGSGKLQYYLYNWRCPRMASDRVGLVLC
ncbi:hypothetical protein BBP00_00004230 [Phytophthora kernoviae]|uniref:Glycylpeptide N-tetradecanoyltransferase n=1 Tax=Phytophthora kernoviae TaxID=325452 RepID=A0A3F2RSB7_9STRA|nr:hypothetical protein BBP00_00004230 [Phytophthora kernoviae]